MANGTELKAECVRKGISMEGLADRIGINPATLYRKTNGKGEFSAPELQAIRKILGLSDEKFMFIFFKD